MITRAIFILFLTLATLQAADKKKANKVEEPPPPPAHLLFVNAVEDRGFTFIVLNGQDVQPRGFRNGQVTGWLGVPAGAHKVQVEHQPLGLVEKETELASDSHHALIAYNHSQPQPETRRPPRPTIGVLWLACDAVKDAGKKTGDGKVPLVIVNATSRPDVLLKVGALKLKAKRLDPLKTRVPVEGNFLALNLADIPTNSDTTEADEPSALASINIEEKAVFYVVLHEKTPGEVGAVTFSLAPPTEATE